MQKVLHLMGRGEAGTFQEPVNLRGEGQAHQARRESQPPRMVPHFGHDRPQILTEARGVVLQEDEVGAHQAKEHRVPQLLGDVTSLVSQELARNVRGVDHHATQGGLFPPLLVEGKQAGPLTVRPLHLDLIHGQAVQPELAGGQTLVTHPPAVQTHVVVDHLVAEHQPFFRVEVNVDVLDHGPLHGRQVKLPSHLGQQPVFAGGRGHGARHRHGRTQCHQRSHGIQHDFFRPAGELGYDPDDGQPVGMTCHVYRFVHGPVDLVEFAQHAEPLVEARVYSRAQTRLCITGSGPEKTKSPHGLRWGENRFDFFLHA